MTKKDKENIITIIAAYIRWGLPSEMDEETANVVRSEMESAKKLFQNWGYTTTIFNDVEEYIEKSLI